MNFLDFDIKDKLKIPKEERLFWDECKLFENSIFILKRFDNIEDLQAYWKSTVDFVAGYIQDNIKVLELSKDADSDIYIIYLCKDSVPNEISLKIESNKFCCKKYVIHNASDGDNWEVIKTKLPLLNNWGIGDADGFVSSGRNNKHVIEKLTDGNDSPLSNLLKSNDAFMELPANEIINNLIQKEDCQTCGGKDHE